MTSEIKLTLPGVATKKTSQRILPIISEENLRIMVRTLGQCARHADAIKILMRSVNYVIHPSEAYCNWFDALYLQQALIRSSLYHSRVPLPIVDPVAVCAKVYCDGRGDLLGYEQAAADAIQADVWQCGKCRKKTIRLRNCRYCDASIASMAHTRKGLGIIGDDKQIVSWDGSEILIDKKRPRFELTIRVLEPKQGSLLAAQEKDEVMA